MTSTFPFIRPAVRGPETKLFPFRGGPYDGAELMVEIDETGVPVEFRSVRDMTTPDAAVPRNYIQSDRLVSLYERVEDSSAPDGYVFEFRNQERFDLNKP